MNISFALTKGKVRAKTKTVTRRLGWWTRKGRPPGSALRIGQLLQPVEQCQGLKKGDTVRPIGGLIRVTRVTRELLYHITVDDVWREGFPWLTTAQFVEMFCQHNQCTPDTEITRIEFKYVD